MGYKKKKKKSLHQQAYDRLKGMQAFGESKREAKKNNATANKIYSFSTWKTYWSQVNRYMKYVKAEHPDCVSIYDARNFMNEYLNKNIKDGKSAWTIHTIAKSLGKFYGIKPSDKDYFKCPIRERKNITRSRETVVRDKCFNRKLHNDIILFVQSTGARRAGLERLRKEDLFTKTKIEKMAKSKNLSTTEKRMITDALKFDDVQYFVHFHEKGGRDRLSPVIGTDEAIANVVAKFNSTPPGAKLWSRVNNAMDVHAERAFYAGEIYKKYARHINEIPFDKAREGSRAKFQSQIYRCRKDRNGIVLDRNACALAAIALGHGPGRVNVIANNYLWRLEDEK